ncbi:MAG: hypothetical protein COS82_03945 [Zetaproteobacteria bacterium CG06_land_8_20_14_3_00_59_53]|nr:MAG: hypothetical protein AUK36_08615 [Zetaproteobacteria bacterium CG2_30_59_37]PIO89138.1 MAG: hypothetical protein COX56_09325 [Zetaproteobacteria bacterium CG23_combo_of_CG06-09_8_20_14_all_59_86]PIQ64451.1 MAG: hypothetical protein COV97_09135 [Zetaproteobacteria bacterium CG11_big_fil_rev_8_21_14_0_20_59_439]PIU70877.1 MAG: hypothetical protein COS82_03945 [Zetaproteobacteria bacterium CG06_land_8_20_14_3_00_59_53]PIU96314.1 MAG: hypothetical protein COS62_09515 [Zetaproteobacteria bac
MPQFDITFYPSEVFWTLVSFALLFGLLKWLVLPRMAAILDARSRAIAEEINAARQQREEAERLKLDYRKQLDAASQEADRMFEESEARLRKQHRQMMEEWKADMKRREAAFREESEVTRQQAIREIRAEAAGMVVEATEKLIHEHVGKSEAEGFINEALEALEKEPAKPRRH